MSKVYQAGDVGSLRAASGGDFAADAVLVFSEAATLGKPAT